VGGLVKFEVRLEYSRHNSVSRNIRERAKKKGGRGKPIGKKKSLSIYEAGGQE